MIKGRTPNIRTEHIRNFANKLVASASNKYGNRAISKEKFKDLMQHAPVQYASNLRGGQKNLTAYQTKKFLSGFLKHVQEHPEYKVSTFARKALNVKLHQGDNLIQGFNEQRIGEKALGAVAEIQQDAEATKDTGPTPEEQIRAKRVAAARRGMNLYQTQKERAEIESGKKTITPTSITAGQEKKSATTATSHEGAGTIAGASRAAGSDAAKPSAPIPGQHASAPLPSRGSVQLAGGIGLSRFDGRPADRNDGIAIPRIGIAKEDPGTAKTVPTPGLKTEVTDIRQTNDADVELPSTKDIDQNLPLAA